MLKPVKRTPTRRGGGTFAIVASQYNRRYVDGMLRAAGRSLRAGGAEKVVVVRVPGAYEIPVVAARLAGAHPTPFSAILCLGVILRRQPSPAQHIGDVV